MHSVYKHSIIRSLVLALDHRVCGEGNECPYPEASCHHESKKCICIYNLQPSTPDGRCKGKSNYWFIRPMGHGYLLKNSYTS